MAGLGTVFVEIQIDRSKFSRSLQQLEREAISSSLQIEDNFKRLGIKSSYEFDLMRQKAVNAYEAIKHSAQATANDILRAEQAKSQQFARINEEQFGKQQAWFERLKELTAGILPGISGLTLGIGGLTTALTGARRIQRGRAGDSASAVVELGATRPVAAPDDHLGAGPYRGVQIAARRR